MRAKRDRRGSSARFHGDGPRDVTLEWSRRRGCGQQAGCSRRRATHGDSTKAIGAFVERSNAGRGLSRQPRPDLRPAVPGRDLAKENRRPLSCPPSSRAIAPPAAAPPPPPPPAAGGASLSCCDQQDSPLSSGTVGAAAACTDLCPLGCGGSGGAHQAVPSAGAPRGHGSRTGRTRYQG